MYLVFAHRSSKWNKTRIFINLLCYEIFFHLPFVIHFYIYRKIQKAEKGNGTKKKKKGKKNYGEIKRTDGNTMKEEEREERDTGFCELLIKPTRNCWRDVYGFIVPFSRALKRPMQWTFCAVWSGGRADTEGASLNFSTRRRNE